jgi:hypothetical protein
VEYVLAKISRITSRLGILNWLLSAGTMLKISMGIHADPFLPESFSPVLTGI